MEFSWKGKDFPMYAWDQIDALAPEFPVVYGLITPGKEIYVGATRSPKSRLRSHLASSSYPQWLDRLAQREFEDLREWDSEMGLTVWRPGSGHREKIRDLQRETRWIILQTFTDAAFAEDMGIAEKAWISGLEASLNSSEAKGTYCNGPKRGLGPQQIATAVADMIPQLHKFEPWTPQHGLCPTVVQSINRIPDNRPLPSPWTQQPPRRFKVEVDLNVIDAVAELADLADWCARREHFPKEIDAGVLDTLAELALELVHDYDSKAVKWSRHHRRGYDSDFAPVLLEAA